jgi:hypothetical protein
MIQLLGLVVFDDPSYGEELTPCQHVVNRRWERDDTRCFKIAQSLFEHEGNMKEGCMILLVTRLQETNTL